MAPLEEGWFERLLCSKNCRSQIIWSFHSVLPFNPSTQKKNEVLYKSSPGFEPTTFLIHDLRTDALDGSATVGRQEDNCPHCYDWQNVFNWQMAPIENGKSLDLGMSVNCNCKIAFLTTSICCCWWNVKTTKWWCNFVGNRSLIWLINLVKVARF